MFAAYLKDFRLRSGLTQQELAEVLGMTQSNVSKYEKGHITIDIYTYRDWAIATKCELLAVKVLFKKSYEVMNEC